MNTAFERGAIIYGVTTMKNLTFCILLSICALQCYSEKFTILLQKSCKIICRFENSAYLCNVITK